MSSEEELKDLAKDMTPSGFQYRTKDSKKGYYAESRDILGFYRPMQASVINIIGARHPDKEDEVKKLHMQANGFINEANTGVRRLRLHEFVMMHDLVMKDIDPVIVGEYMNLMCAAFMYRFVLAKRSQRVDMVDSDELGHSFEASYIMSVLPEDLAAKVEHHLQAYAHVAPVIFNNHPPAVLEKVDEADGK